MRVKWETDRLYYLLYKPVRIASIIFPENTYESLKQTRKEYKHKIARGEVMTPEKPANFNPEDTPEQIITKLVAGDLSAQAFSEDGAIETSSWEGYIKNSDGEIEYTRPMRSVRKDLRKNHKIEDFISQADPIHIRTSTAKPIKRAFKLILAFGDSQIDYRKIDDEYIPIHDERALAVVTMINKALLPDLVVDLGDTVDFSSLSRFAKDSDHFDHSLNPAINRAHRLMAQISADNPKAEKVAVSSNHERRLGALVLKHVPMLYGLRQSESKEKYPVLSYPFLTNMASIDWDWIGGYEGAEKIYGEEYGKPPIVFKHGQTLVSAGSTANKESKDNPETHIVRGHGHQNQMHYRTNRNGDYLASVMVGCTCSIMGDVPSYHSAVDDLGKVVKNQESWQQSVLLIEDYGGDYNFINIPINKGVAFYNGKRFDASGVEGV